MFTPFPRVKEQGRRWVSAPLHWLFCRCRGEGACVEPRGLTGRSGDLEGPTPLCPSTLPRTGATPMMVVLTARCILAGSRQWEAGTGLAAFGKDAFWHLHDTSARSLLITEPNGREQHYFQTLPVTEGTTLCALSWE